MDKHAVLHTLFKIYLQMDAACRLNSHGQTSKIAYAKQRIVADALLSILNDPQRARTYIAKMQSDFTDKKIDCTVPDVLDQTFVLDRIRYRITRHHNRSGDRSRSTTNGSSMRIAYRLHFTVNGEALLSQLHARVPNTVYQSMLRQASERAIVRLVCYYTLLGLQTGQFWGLSPTFYKRVTDVDRASLECFGSPFNHVLPDYCSPMAAIDRAFGSVGNFFSVFPSDTTWSTYIINPPFVLSVMTTVFTAISTKLVMERKRNRRIRIIIYLPNWRDVTDPLLQQLTRSGRGVRSAVLSSGHSVVWDFGRQMAITAHFECILIMVNSMDASTGDHHPVDAPLFKRLVSTMTQHTPNAQLHEH